jgi:hypothetical protein
LVITLAFSAAARAQIGIGASGGFAGSVTKEGVSGFSETKFKPSKSYGFNLSYRFRNGLLLGVRAEQFRMALRENDADFGTLKVRPLMLTLGYQGRPEKGRGFAGHVQLSGGIGQTRFEKGPAITDLERLYKGAQIVVSTKRAPVVELNAGVDYFISRYLSFTTDFRILLSNIGTNWSVVGNRTVAMPDINKFFASNGQVLGGLRIWLW